MVFELSFKKIVFTAFLLVVMISVVADAVDARKESAFEKIDALYASGAIDRSEMLVDKVVAFCAPQKLASELKGEVPGVMKSGTPLITEVRDNWSIFSDEQQSLLTSLLARPNLEATFDSPGGFFKIHYDTASSSGEQVPMEDNNSNNIPDYVERIAQYCDSARSMYTGQLGYLPAPTDTNGGDSLYDVYLLSIPAYGATYPEVPADSAWDDYTSFMSIHYNFYGFPANDDPEGDTIGAQKVTCAHEFYHATQMAYDRYADAWWRESSATWMEDVVFPEVNDNYNYLPYFFNDPHVSLSYFDISSLHPYGAFVFPGFLYQKFGPDILRSIWEYCRFYNTIPAIDSALAQQGTRLKEEFPEFAIWNYFTGGRYIPGRFYADAADYPLMPLEHIFTSLAVDSIHPVNGPDGLSCNYIRFNVDTSAHGQIEMYLNGSDVAQWALGLIIENTVEDTVQAACADGNQPIRIYHPYAEDYQTVVAIPAVTSQFTNNNDYILSSIVVPHGDANHDYAVNVGDAIYIVNHVFKGGPAPVPLWQSGDANCDARINIGDAVAVVNFVFNGGAAPCSNYGN